MKHQTSDESDPLTRSGDFTNDPKGIQAHTRDGTTPGPTADEKAKKKKIIKWAIIITLIVIIVTLAIVLPLVLIKHNDDPPSPPVNPPVEHYNPYKVND